jgi:hypothetical protein
MRPVNQHDIGQDFGTELYPTLGYTKKIGEYSLTIGVSYEDLHQVFDFEKTDFLVISGEISRDFQLTPKFSLSPFLRLESNFTFDGQVNGDTLIKPGVRYAWKLSDNISLAGKLMLVYDPGLLSNEVAWVGNAEASLLWKLNEHAILELPYVRYVDPLNSVSDGRKSDVIYGFGVTFKF